MIGRFINADDPEILFEDQDNLLQYNLYTYCFNNPVNMSDPDGKAARAASRLLIYGGLSMGGVLGVAFVVVGVVVTAYTVYRVAKKVKQKISYYKEHTSTKNGKKRNKHENGNARRQRDQGGEKKKQKPGWYRPR